jgi:hypothetical protein
MDDEYFKFLAMRRNLGVRAPFWSQSTISAYTVLPK